ncbi:hypothetical protein NHP22001_02670 [Helicobacter sp. NHP22-001]|nr:hypothetical protein NHP22001_02670 [Helicobacter sp. NHP22-001]
MLFFSFGCGAPGWVQNCPTKAYTEQSNLLACASAPIVGGDVDYATNLAGTKARDEMASWVLAEQRQAPKQAVRVELVGARLESKWVDASKVYVLFSVDLQAAKKAKIAPIPTHTKEPETKESQENTQSLGMSKPPEKTEELSAPKVGAPKANLQTPTPEVNASKKNKAKGVKPGTDESKAKEPKGKGQQKPLQVEKKGNNQNGTE